MEVVPEPVRHTISYYLPRPLGPYCKLRILVFPLRFMARARAVTYGTDLKLSNRYILQ